MGKQVFQTDSKSRWNHFKLGFRVSLLVVLLFLAIFVSMLVLERSPNLPFKGDYKEVISAQKPFLKQTKFTNDYKNFRDYISKGHKASMSHRGGSVLTKSMADSLARKCALEWSKNPAGIRAAWYVTWDPQSYLSLKHNIGSLNLVIPEWFFVKPQNGNLETRIDRRGYELMRKSGIAIMPMLTNNYDGSFNGEPIKSVMRDPKRRKAFIGSLLGECLRHGFCGINVDLEELNLESDLPLTNFMKELGAEFHSHGLYVTQSIMASNEEYNVKELSSHVDYFFLMAYDEHMTLTEPGAISSQQWISRVTDQLADKVENGKIVLGMAAYGYDWNAKGDNNQTVTFDQAMTLASTAGAEINFNPDTYNLDFSYRDSGSDMHRVYFTDAATQWNIMRFGSEYGIAGFCIWRLGGEDGRLWDFYRKNMQQSGASRYDFRSMESLPELRDVDFIGEGEVLYAESSPHRGKVGIETDDNLLICKESYDTLPSSFELHRYGKAGGKELVLTFDDGPDRRWTPQILKILKERHVPAAFFMVGLQMERNLPIVKQVYDDGHLIGNHTFTHHNIIENSRNRTLIELKLTRMLIECATGHSSVLFRAPYNADSDPGDNEEVVPIVIAAKQNYVNVGESIDPNDWQPGISAAEIVERVVDGAESGKGSIILLHDAGGNTRKETVKALPVIIDTLEKKGYKFISLDQYLGKTRSELMPPIPKGDEYYAVKANLMVAQTISKISDFVVALFVVFLILGMARFLFMWILTFKERRAMKHRQFGDVSPANAPAVSIIVPAYNEEVNAVATLANLLKQDYPDFEVIFVDDGSSDATLQRVTEAFEGNQKVKILSKPNGGKASALNYGISHSTRDFVVCIDADTKLQRNAVKMLMRHYIRDEKEKVGAVAGYVAVGNQCNMLTRWQAIEYTTSQNFDRMAYAAINAITVVPGAIGAFRKSAIDKAGGFTTDTLAEDCDLTIRILEAGYVIENESEAVALTEAPEQLRQFVKQRTRWCFGVMQTFWKHRHGIFERRYKGLGIWALPNMLVFQFLIPTFSPLADLLMLIGLFSGSAMQILLYYLIFLLVDASVSIMAYVVERNRMWVLLWIIPQRLVYRWIMYYVLYKSYLKAIKGELQSWGVLKRTGDVGNV